MGEKGNLLDVGEEIFANLAEQGPEFWLNYEQYKKSRSQSAETPAVAGQKTAADARGHAAEQDPPSERSAPPTAE